MSEPTVVIVNSATFDKAIAIPNAVGVRYFHMTDEELQALREFFLAERDAELGRWRDPEASDYVVYPCPDDEYIRVVNERTGVAQKQWGDTHVCDDTHDTARRYFAAHPEPKPWESAEVEDVWILKLINDPRNYPAVMTTHGWAIEVAPFDSSIITDGKRIWPPMEVSGE